MLTQILDTSLPISTVKAVPTWLSKATLAAVVGNGLRADEFRELLIKALGDLMQEQYAIWDKEGCFDAKGRADMLLGQQNRLICERSPEMVAKLERERGLA